MKQRHSSTVWPVIRKPFIFAIALCINYPVFAGRTDPDVPIDYVRNPAVERALQHTLSNSPLSPEEKTQHVLNRLGYGAGQDSHIRYLLRQTDGIVDEAKTDAAIVRFIMHALTKKDYYRNDVEQFMESEFGNSQLTYAQLSEESRIRSSNITAKKQEIESLVAQQTVPPNSQLVEAIRRAQDELVNLQRDWSVFRKDLWTAAQARFIANSIASGYSIQNKLVYLWFNRLNVNGEKIAFDLNDYIRVISQHTHGRFEDMVLASARHPAMLIYLNNHANKADDALGIQPNEDYARELMELHTLGKVASTTSGPSSYTVEDVRSAARIMAGWSVNTQSGKRKFSFWSTYHPRGGKSLLGQTFVDGEQGGIDFIVSLSRNRATAQSIAKMLVRYFVSDNLSTVNNPDIQSLLADLTASYLETHGNLEQLYWTLVTHRSFWSRSSFRSKVKDPIQQVVSTLKAAGHGGGTFSKKAILQAIETSSAMGLKLFLCPPPTGYPIDSSQWASANNVMRSARFGFELANFVGQRFGGTVYHQIERDASLAMELGNTALAMRHLNLAFYYVYNQKWHKPRYRLSSEKLDRFFEKSLAFPDLESGVPRYLRSAAGLFLGSMEFSIH